MIYSIIGTVIIPLMMFMIFSIYIMVVFAESYCGWFARKLKKILKIIYKPKQKRKD